MRTRVEPVCAGGPGQWGGWAEGLAGSPSQCPASLSGPTRAPRAHSPEIVLLIFTKIFSKSAKSLQDDWNMCMKRLMNRFSILRKGGEHHPREPGAAPSAQPLLTLVLWSLYNPPGSGDLSPGQLLAAADRPVEPGQKPAPTPMRSSRTSPVKERAACHRRQLQCPSPRARPSVQASVHPCIHSFSVQASRAGGHIAYAAALPRLLDLGH